MTNKNGAKSDMNLVKLIDRFHSEEKCLAYLEQLRWPSGVACPRCGSTSISRIQKRGQFDCNSCRYQFSITSGTIFHDSHLPLWKWFLTAYMMAEAKKGVSANQVKRTIGVSYKTAWYLCHRIRAAMTEVNPEPLKGIVEVDETWIGGKHQNMGHGYTGNKTAVVGAVGAVERGGPIRLKVVGDRGRKTLHDFIHGVVAPNAEAIYTDDWPPYKGIADHDTRHETVNHSAKEWVCGDVHTNTIEGVWSLFKRSVIGSYHKVSTKHLDAYLDELEWRFNNRDNPFLFRDTLRKLLLSETLPYQNLVES
ncbi:MAG: IS1595 family transposase [Chloroflexi bacterium]|nr:IS1595 family transposase [Chloroflexota bacterium]